MSTEEKRLRKHMIDIEIKQADIVRGTGLSKPFVSAVIRGYSHCPAHIRKVYEFIGLTPPVAVKRESIPTPDGGVRDQDFITRG